MNLSCSFPGREMKSINPFPGREMNCINPFPGREMVISGPGNGHFRAGKWIFGEN